MTSCFLSSPYIARKATKRAIVVGVEYYGYKDKLRG
ncbi:hypothetical protein A2U01_0070300, partial [Trifolium medium]|nr:hypothetical protein [Trifolium medium]